VRSDEGNCVGLSGVTRQSANQQGELCIELTFFKEEEGKCWKCWKSNVFV
jgi:hypothetical protein